jgi:undecaprenyl-diphosphatase
MEALFAGLLDWVRAHPYWAGLAVFAIAFAESLAIIGVVVPGVVIMFGVGALVAAGAADFWAICGWAVAGAVAGDGLSYWLGRRYRADLRGMWPFRLFPRTLQDGERFFLKHGGISVVLGRFFGPGRAAVPLIAGMLDMPPRAFLAANIGSALLWAPAYLLPGVVLGASLELASEVALRLVILLLLLIAVAWFSGWAAHRVFKQLQPRTSELLARLLRLGDRFAWLRRMAEAMANPQHPEARGLAVFGGLLVLGAAALTLVSTLLADLLPWAAADRLVHRTFDSLRTEAADHLLGALAAPGQPLSLAVLGGVVALFLLLARRRIALLHWLGGLAGVAVAYGLLGLTGAGNGSGSLAPDPGTFGAGVLCGLLAALIAPAVGPRFRWLAYGGGVVLITLALFARLYLGLATLGGALTGALLALIWVAGVAVAYRTHALDQPLSPALGGGLAGGVALVLLGLALLAPASPPDHPAPAPRLLELTAWQSGGWRQLPLLRGDLLASQSQPLNLQYAGAPAELDRLLQAAGWIPAEVPSASDLLRQLSPSLPLADLPLLPHVHDSRHEQHAWLLQQGPSRLVLRLWPSGYRIPGTGSLWLGEISWQRQRNLFDLIGYAVTTDDYAAALQQFAQQLGRGTRVQGPHGPLLLLQLD